MIFNPKEAISFEGDTGPYIQYSYARASSIIKKAKIKKTKFKMGELNSSEIELIKTITQSYTTVMLSYIDKINPDTVAANQVIELSQRAHAQLIKGLQSGFEITST